MKLFAQARPGDTIVEVAALEVSEPSGTVLLSGRYRVPGDATRFEIAVPLYSGSATNTRTRATAFLAVEP